MRVLVTGAAGFVGRHLTRALEGVHELRLGDVRPLDDPRWVPLDVTNPEQVREAMSGVEAVVHRANHPQATRGLGCDVVGQRLRTGGAGGRGCVGQGVEQPRVAHVGTASWGTSESHAGSDVCQCRAHLDCPWDGSIFRASNIANRRRR